MGSRVGELVLFVISFGERDEDSEVVLAGSDFDACSCELGGELVESSSREAFLGTVDEEGRDGWVVRCLLCEVRNLDFLA